MKRKATNREYPMFKLETDEIPVLRWILWKYRLGISAAYLCHNLKHSNQTHRNIKRKIHECLCTRDCCTLDAYMDLDFDSGLRSRRKRWIKLLLEHNKRG